MRAELKIPPSIGSCYIGYMSYELITVAALAGQGDLTCVLRILGSGAAIIPRLTAFSPIIFGAKFFDEEVFLC